METKKSKLLREIIARKLAENYEKEIEKNLMTQNEKKIEKAREEYYCR